MFPMVQGHHGGLHKCIPQQSRQDKEKYIIAHINHIR